MKTPRPQFAKDFFFELMKDSQRLRAGYLAERERWLAAVSIDGREELLFELEMLLRGVERYFNLHNLPIEEQAPVVARDFTEELKCVRDAVSRCSQLARRLLDPPADQRLMFRKYLESRVADDRVRHDLIEQELDQATPQESLFLIRSGFTAQRGVIDALLKLPHCGYALFSDVGQMTLREMALNKYFKPLRPMEFRAEYDRIKNVRVLEIVRGIAALEIRRPVTLGFLALFRLMHYVRYLPADPDPQQRRALVIVALLRSEFQALSSFLEAEAARIEHRSPEKATILSRAAVALRKDSARTWKRELGQVGRATPAALVRVKREFASLCQEQAVLIAKAFEPKLTEADLFDDLVSKQEQAKRLRLDLCAYREVVNRMARALTNPVAEEGRDALDGMKKFIVYFRDVSYQLLRYGDYEPFDRFQALVAEQETVPPAPVQRSRMGDDLRLFREVLDKTFSSVCRREELASVPFNELDGVDMAELFVRAS